MREILFKGKTENGRWIEGDLINYESGEVAILEKFSKYGYEATEICRRTKVLPETICQLIQTDKVRVWENDIVRWEYDDEIISVIRYDEENARFVFDDYGIKGCLMEYGWDEDAGSFGKVDTNGFDAFYSFDFEVIGNIFDNLELIKRT